MVLGLLVLLVVVQILVLVVVQMLVLMLVVGLGTSGGGSAASVDLCLLRFGGMVLLLSSQLPTSCSGMYELTAGYL